MANPRRPGAGAGSASDVLDPDIPPPIDPDELKQIQMLAEAVLVSFGATPNPIPPFGTSTLQWDVTLPTTELPGVNVEVHLYDGIGDDVVMPQGQRLIGPYGETEYAIYLKAPKAARHMGTFSISVDMSQCEVIEIAPIFFVPQIKSEAEQPFPSGGTVTLRGGGASVDIGINSFVIDIPLTASINNWFDPDIDVTMGFSLWSENGEVRARHDLARTEVSPGTLSTILSGGCASKVAEAVEGTSDGYLDNFVGPEIARRMRNSVQANVDHYLAQLNAQSRPVPLKFYDLSLTQDGMTFRYCQAHAPRPSRPLDDDDLRPF
jgi:hypothetical protein